MRYFHRTLLLACAAPAALLGSGAFAQQAQPQDQSSSLEEIVVTARRTAEKLQDIPVPVSVLTTRDLQEQQIQAIDDIGNGLPNVNITPSQLGQADTPYITIRGITNASQGISQDNPIGLYLDGVYLGYSAGLSFELADLAQIEVLRGPQGTLFGKNTTAGAISMTTKTPTGVFDAHLETGYGDYASKHLKLSFDLPEWNGFSVRMTALHNERDGYVKNLFPQQTISLPPPFGTATTAKDFGSLDNTGTMISMRYTGVENLTVDYKFDYIYSNSDHDPVQVLGFTPGGLEGTIQGIILKPPPGSITVPIPAINGTGYLSALPDNVTSPGHDMVFGHSLTIQYDFSDNLILKSISAYRQQRDNQGIGMSGGGEAITTSPTGIPGFDKGPAGGIYCWNICSDQLRSLNQISEEFQAIGHEGTLDWIAGAFYFDQRGFMNNPSFLTGTILNNTITSWPLGFIGNAYALGGGLNTSESQSVALYAHATQHVNDVVDLSAGLRYTQDFRHFIGYSTTSPGALTGIGPLIPIDATGKSYSNVDWDASVTWKVMDGVNLYGKVSTAFLSGGLLNAVAFDPVYETNYELGLKSDWLDHRLRVNIDAYHRVQRDNQGAYLYDGQANPPVPPGTPFGIVIVSNPLLYTHFNGLEIESVAAPVKGLKLGVNAGFESAPATAGLASSRPPINLGFNGAYDFARFDNGMFFSYRIDSTWVSKHNEGLSTALLASATPQLLAALTDEPVWKLDMRASLIDIPLGPVKGTAALWVKNLTDSHTLNIGLDLGSNIAGSYDLPRMYGFDLTFDY